MEATGDGRQSVVVVVVVVVLNFCRSAGTGSQLGTLDTFALHKLR